MTCTAAFNVFFIVLTSLSSTPRYIFIRLFSKEKAQANFFTRTSFFSCWHWRCSTLASMRSTTKLLYDYNAAKILLLFVYTNARCVLRNWPHLGISFWLVRLPLLNDKYLKIAAFLCFSSTTECVPLFVPEALQLKSYQISGGWIQ